MIIVFHTILKIIEYYFLDKVNWIKLILFDCLEVYLFYFIFSVSIIIK